MPRKKKIPRKTLAIFLATGAALSLGFLAFAGMLAISSLLPLAILAAVFAGGVEGVIYWRNINTSFKRILTPHFLEDAILADTLNRLLDKKNFCSSHTTGCFLDEYQKQCEEIKKLKALPNDAKKYAKYISSLTPEEKKKWPLNALAKEVALAAAKQNLYNQQVYFKKFINENMGATTPTNLFNDEELNTNFNPERKRQLRSEINRKILFTRLSWILVLISGLSSGLVGITMVSSLITYFFIPLTGIALSASIFGLAGLGAVGYVFLTYKSLADIIQNNTLHHWFKNIAELKQKQQYVKLIGGIFLTVLIVGLGIFATIATAGTWWYAVKAATHLLPFFSQVLPWLRDLVIPIVAIVATSVTNLVYTLINSFTSVGELMKLPQGMQSAFYQLKNIIKNHWHHENLLQFFNPFRFIAITIDRVGSLAIFIFHVCSMGLMGDKLANIPAVITAAVNAGSEALNDAHHFIPENPNQPPEPDHDHSDGLPETLLHITLIPFHFLSAGWDWFFSQLNSKAEDQLSLNKAWEKACYGLRIVPTAQPAAEDEQKPTVKVMPQELAASSAPINTYTKLLMIYQVLSKSREQLDLEFKKDIKEKSSPENRKEFNEHLLVEKIIQVGKIIIQEAKKGEVTNRPR
jgi:hypothetical protein